MKKNKGLKDGDVIFNVTGVWTIYPDNKAHKLFPRWWHKFMFWKRWNYGEWKIKQEYKKLSDIMDDFIGVKTK
jgi:hypothetical protein